MYKQVPKKEADGIAWVFTNKDSDLVQMPYKVKLFFLLNKILFI